MKRTANTNAIELSVSPHVKTRNEVQTRIRTITTQGRLSEPNAYRKFAPASSFAGNLQFGPRALHHSRIPITRHPSIRGCAITAELPIRARRSALLILLALARRSGHYALPVRPTIDPSSLVGTVVVKVVVGWHRYQDAETAERLFLTSADERTVELHTAGDGSIVVVPCEVPNDYDMAEMGRYEFRDTDLGHPAAVLIGYAIEAVQPLPVKNVAKGFRLVTASGAVEIANDYDELRVSAW